jgi:hypothetical protein
MINHDKSAFRLLQELLIELSERIWMQSDSFRRVLTNDVCYSSAIRRLEKVDWHSRNTTINDVLKLRVTFWNLHETAFRSVVGKKYTHGKISENLDKYKHVLNEVIARVNEGRAPKNLDKYNGMVLYQIKESTQGIRNRPISELGQMINKCGFKISENELQEIYADEIDRANEWDDLIKAIFSGKTPKRLFIKPRKLGRLFCNLRPYAMSIDNMGRIVLENTFNDSNNSIALGVSGLNYFAESTDAGESINDAVGKILGLAGATLFALADFYVPTSECDKRNPQNDYWLELGFRPPRGIKASDIIHQITFPDGEEDYPIDIVQRIEQINFHLRKLQAGIIPKSKSDASIKTQPNPIRWKEGDADLSTDLANCADGLSKRAQILCDIFKTTDDWSDRGKIDDCCRKMEVAGVRYPRKRDGGVHGSNLEKWTELIDKTSKHVEFQRLFGDLRRSTLYTEWRKTRKKLRK